MMRKTKDGFIWKVLSEANAKDIFLNTSLELFSVYDDDSESLIERYRDLETAIELNIDICIAVGYDKKQ